MKANIITDDYFGELTVTKDKQSQTFYLEKKIGLSTFLEVTLSLENSNFKATEKQFELYKLIQDNIQQILIVAEKLYYDNYKVNLYEEFYIDSILINDTEDNFAWELWLLKKGRFENCIIEFDKLAPKHLSFSA
jgi:hypothetical protein